MRYSKLALSIIAFTLAFSLLFSTVGKAALLSSSIIFYMVVGYMGSQMAVTTAMNPAVQSTVYATAGQLSSALSSLPSQLGLTKDQALVALSTTYQRLEAAKTFNDVQDATDLIKDITTSYFTKVHVSGIQDYRSYIVDRNVRLAGGKVCRDTYGLEESCQPQNWKIFLEVGGERKTIDVPWRYQCVLFTPIGEIGN